MYLTAHQTRNLSKVMALLAEDCGCSELRLRVGEVLLELLRADYLASFIWDSAQQAFTQRVCINMGEANLQAYERYYQFRDPITPQLQQRRTATLVSEIMTQEALMKTEFFNDFLKCDGLHYGINLYAYHGNANIGDLRIWRAQQRGNFSAEAVALLDLIRPAFVQALRRTQSLEAPLNTAELSPKEREVARWVSLGKSDKEVARILGLQCSTVRTHLEHIHQKLGTKRRGELAQRLRPPH